MREDDGDLVSVEPAVLSDEFGEGVFEGTLLTSSDRQHVLRKDVDGRRHTRTM